MEDDSRVPPPIQGIRAGVWSGGIMGLTQRRKDAKVLLLNRRKQRKQRKRGSGPLLPPLPPVEARPGFSNRARCGCSTRVPFITSCAGAIAGKTSLWARWSSFGFYQILFATVPDTRRRKRLAKKVLGLI